MNKILGTLLATILGLSVLSASPTQADTDQGVGTAIAMRDFSWNPPNADCAMVFTFLVKAKPGTGSMRPETQLTATIIKEDMIFPKMVKATRKGNRLVWRVSVGPKADVLDASVRVSWSGVSPKRLPARAVCSSAVSPMP